MMRRMRKSFFAAMLACSVSVVSCTGLLDDTSAMQLLMGADSRNLVAAFGSPSKMEGSLANGRITWNKSSTIDGSEYYSDTEAISRNYQVVELSSVGNYHAVLPSWREKNQAMIRLNSACASNDLVAVQRVFTNSPKLLTTQVILQAAAQAARYNSHETLHYLVDEYEIDMDAPFVTWVESKDDSTRYVLARVTLDQLM